MAFWIYKCNSRNVDYQRAFGDWSDVFNDDKTVEWGSTEVVPALKSARAGDTILAYQTNRNELCGTARVVRLKPRNGYFDLYLKPLRRIGVKVRPLKADPLIAAIPALQGGPIKTLYPIERSEVRRLLRAANALLDESSIELSVASEWAQGDAGFGRAESNRKVERAAMKCAIAYFTRKGYKVRNVSDKKQLGYDLVCSKAGKHLHVEVKGASGSQHAYIMTHAERENWKTDAEARVALVCDALSNQPTLSLYRDCGDFVFRPISYFVYFKADLSR